MNRALIHAQRKFAAIQAGQFGKSLFYLIAQVDQPLGIFPQQRTGIRQSHWTRATHEKWVPESVLKLANRQADCRLSAVEPFCGTRKAAFASNRQKHL